MIDSMSIYPPNPLAIHVPLFGCLGSTMVQKTVDYLVLSGTAITLRTAVILLKWMRRSETSEAWEKTEARSTAVFPA